MMCDKCGGEMLYYDKVNRKVRVDHGNKIDIPVSRFRCSDCHHIQRRLPYFLMPEKHYPIPIIKGFLTGLYSSENPSFEDFPADQTVKRWANEYLH